LVTEEPLHHIELRSGRGREVNVKPRMLLQPCPDPGVFVSGIVVIDQVKCFVFWGFPVNLAQNFNHWMWRCLC
jgi:hypothetical protein